MGLDLVKGFAEKLVGGAIEEAGLIISERVRLRRLNNQITILEKAQKIAEKRNIDIKQINLKVLVTLLEYTSLEEEERLQDMWANLIANYSALTIDRQSQVYPFVLSQINAAEAKILDLIYKSNDNQVIFEKRNDILYLNIGERLFKFDVTLGSLNNFVRLGLIDRMHFSSGGNEFKRIERWAYRLTELGEEFLMFCNSEL